MGLFANLTSQEAVKESFPTAQHMRELLSRHGFFPIVKIGDGEHWVRDGRRVILVYEGDFSSSAPPKALMYATLIQIGDEWTIDLD